MREDFLCTLRPKKHQAEAEPHPFPLPSPPRQGSTKPGECRVNDLSSWSWGQHPRVYWLTRRAIPQRKLADSAVLQERMRPCCEVASCSILLSCTVAGISCAHSYFSIPLCVLLLFLCAHHAGKIFCTFVFALSSINHRKAHVLLARWFCRRSVARLYAL